MSEVAMSEVPRDSVSMVESSCGVKGPLKNNLLWMICFVSVYAAMMYFVLVLLSIARTVLSVGSAMASVSADSMNVKMSSKKNVVSFFVILHASMCV